MKLEYRKSFLKDVAKLNPHQKDQLAERLNLFQENPEDPRLGNHRLKGDLDAFRSINITGDIRAIFRENGNVCTLVRLGTHSQLYG